MRAFLLGAAVIAAPVQAQTGAFDMGQMTGTVAMDAVTQAEEGRAGAAKRSKKAPAISAATRTRLQAACRQMRGRGDAGTGLADYRQFDAMCLRHGF